jgi:hypothetical protein
MNHEAHDNDELLAKLRVLPAPKLDDAFVQQVRRESLAALAKPNEKPALVERTLKNWVELIAERVLLPLSLAGTTAAYLMWAVDAASRVYR